MLIPWGVLIADRDCLIPWGVLMRQLTETALFHGEFWWDNWQRLPYSMGSFDSWQRLPYSMGSFDEMADRDCLIPWGVLTRWLTETALFQGASSSVGYSWATIDLSTSWFTDATHEFSTAVNKSFESKILNLSLCFWMLLPIRHVFNSVEVHYFRP